MTEERITVWQDETSAETAREDGQTPLMYPGQGGVDDMMKNMMQNMSRGVSQSRSRSIQATVDTLRVMSCEREEIMRRLVSGFGISEEEAAGYLGSE